MTVAAARVADYLFREDALPRAHGPAVGGGRLRERPEDFQVEEDLGFAPGGDGEHLFVQVRKRGWNTEDVAKLLSRVYGVRRGSVSFAGLKDRNAVTTQWFSVHLPGREAPAVSATVAEGVEILRSERHGRKLRRGALAGNRFRLRVEVTGVDRASVHRRLAAIARDGVPNYFGAQRFGRRGDNVAQAMDMFQGRRVPRHIRGLLLSAVRSHLFNAVLARRVASGTWDGWLDGDVMMLAGSHSMFVPEPNDPRIVRRLALFDVHPTGPLPGEGEKLVSGSAAVLEQEILTGFPSLTDGLRANRVEADRRPLRLLAEGMSWRERSGGGWELTFRLPAGAYATTVLREAFDLTA